jgi:hypothetical protein
MDRIAEAGLETGIRRYGLPVRIPIQIHGNRGSPWYAEYKPPAKAAPFLRSPKVYRPKDVQPVPLQSLQESTFLRVAWRRLLHAHRLQAHIHAVHVLQSQDLVEPLHQQMTNGVSRNAGFDH